MRVTKIHYHLHTMVQNKKKHSKISHLIIYFPTSSGVSEGASEQMNERSGVRDQSEQCGASE